jgi:hypothetical protein
MSVIELGGLRRPPVEGYCDRRSYLPGETVVLHCSSDVSTFDVEVARVGSERVVVWRAEAVAGARQDTPADASTRGCGWTPTLSFDVADDWRSGCYIITFGPAGARGPDLGDAMFVVRSREPTADALLVLSTNTYNAYNAFGGDCLYTGVTQVSFQRPLLPGYLRRPVDPDGFDGRFAAPVPEGDRDHLGLLDYQARHGLQMWISSGGWWNWERRFVRWAESTGIDLDYATNADLEFAPEVVTGHRLLVSMGHDEYWSWTMRDTHEAHVAAGGNAAFFGGNNVLWQVRYEDDGDTMVCFKGDWKRDPVLGTDDEQRLSTCFVHPRVGRPENTTTGLSFFRGGYVRIGDAVPRSSGTYTVHRPDHWALAGTGLRYGDQLGAVSHPVGYECDGCAFELVHGLPVPTGEDATPDSFEIVATTPARLISISMDGSVDEAPTDFWASHDPPGDLEGASMVLFGDAETHHTDRLAHNHAVLGSFTVSGGGTVFNAGTCDWAYGLDDDPVVQQVTRNVFHHLGSPPPT